MKKLTLLLLLLGASVSAQNQKISDLTSGSPVQATDMIPIARGAANFRLAGSDFLSSAGGATGCTNPPFSFTADTNAGMCITAANTLIVSPGANAAISIGWLGMSTTAGFLYFYDAGGLVSGFQALDASSNIFVDDVARLQVTATQMIFGNTGTEDRLIVDPVAKGAGQFDATVTSADLTAARTWTMPDATGDVAVIASAGFPVRTGAATWATRSLTSGDGSIVVFNPAGTSGNPDLTVDSAVFSRFSSGLGDASGACSPGTFHIRTDTDRAWFCTDTSPTWTAVAVGTGTAAGTNTGDVSLAGTPNYITITGQAITRGTIDVVDLSNGTDGNLITWDASGAPAVVATGDAGQVLTSNGVGTAPTFQAAGAASLPVVDTTSIVEGSVDNTKEIRFEVDGLTTATVRVLTPPNANITIAGQDFANLMSARNTFGTAVDAANAIDIGETAGQVTFEGTGVDTFETRIAVENPTVDHAFTFPNFATSFIAVLSQDHGASAPWTGHNAFSERVTISVNGGITFRESAANTPDSIAFQPSSLSNSIHVQEVADISFDFNNGPCGTAACVNPQHIVHDKDQNITNYQSVGVSGLSGRFIVTLTETTETSVVQIPVASGAGVGGQLQFTVFASDGTDHQTLAGSVYFSAVNKAGTETCSDPTIVGVALNSNSSGTLTCLYTCDETPANAVNLQLDCTSSLTQTTLEAYATVILVGPGEPLPQ
jgi:hypothetical protein